MDNCKICCRRFQNHSRKIMCCVCNNEFHIKCVTLSPEGIQQLEQNHTNWFCQTCITEIFPFNKLEDDLDFLSVLKDMCMSSQQSFSYLSEKLFIPFELNDDDHVSALSDVDPDLNFSSSYNQVGAKCNYYLESSFNEDIAENKCIFCVSCKYPKCLQESQQLRKLFELVKPWVHHCWFNWNLVAEWK